MAVQLQYVLCASLARTLHRSIPITFHACEPRRTRYWGGHKAGYRPTQTVTFILPAQIRSVWGLLRAAHTITMDGVAPSPGRVVCRAALVLTQKIAVPLGLPNGKARSDEAAFLKTICGEPVDETAGLVYADWLGDQNGPGDVARADLIRLWCESDTQGIKRGLLKTLESKCRTFDCGAALSGLLFMRPDTKKRGQLKEQT